MPMAFVYCKFHITFCSLINYVKIGSKNGSLTDTNDKPLKLLKVNW